LGFHHLRPKQPRPLVGIDVRALLVFRSGNAGHDVHPAAGRAGARDEFQLAVGLLAERRRDDPRLDLEITQIVDDDRLQEDENTIITPS